MRRCCIVTLGFVWLFATGFGLSHLHAYMNTPGQVGIAPHVWPEGIDLKHTPGQPHLLVFLHRQCPCSSATLGAAQQFADIEQLTVVFVGDPEETSRTGQALEEQARAMTDRVVDDTTGQLAQRFGAMTSGHAVAYDAKGSLAYSGGLTPGRGMNGPAGGQRSLEQLRNNQPITHDTHAVYGCPLFPQDHPQPSCCKTESE